MKKIILFFKKIILWLKNDQYKNPPAKIIELPDYNVKVFDWELRDLINSERKKHNLSEIYTEHFICRVAASHSQYMAFHDKASHDYASARQNLFPNKILSEIVGYGYQNPMSYVSGWLKSESHNEKMMDKDNYCIGIASYTSETGVKYVTVLFLK